MAQLQSLTIDDSGSLTLPVGTSANRPAVTATVQSFTTVTTTSWTCPAGVSSVEVLVVAGGGAGGGGNPDRGGGGGGGIIYNSNYPVVAGTSYTVTVGGGGGANSSSQGANGSNSVFDALVAIGGGGGANFQANGSAGGSGGGGGGGSGGAGYWDANNGGQGGTSTFGQGSAGGTGGASSPLIGTGRNNGGGGGGAGGPGSNAGPGNAGGAGGPGAVYNISGSPTVYSGGGGGGANSGTGGVGGLGGGGAGGAGSGNGTNGIANTGGGGGAGATSGAGGSGIVIVRYSTPSSNTRATAQTRFNTQTNTTESYTNNNRWTVQDPGDPITPAGLVLHYDASRYGSGTVVNDLSGFGNNGTLDGGTAFSSSNKGLFVFDGSNDLITVANSASLRPTTELTIELWLRASVVQTSGWTKLIGHNPYANGYLIFLEASATQEIRATIFTSSGEIRCNTPVRITANNFIHVVFTFKMGDAIRSYFNADPSTVSTLPTGTFTYANTAAPIQIGGTESPNFFNGGMGSIKIYNRALTENEVEQNFNSQALRYGLGPKNTLGSSPRRAAASTEALRAAGITSDGPYWIKPLGQPAHLTYCKFGYIDGGDWMLLLKVHNRADMDGDSANWSNATLINPTDMNLVSGSMSKYGIWNTFRFTRLMMQMADRIPPIMQFNTPRTMFEAVNATTPRANGVGVPCAATDPQISTSANTSYDAMPMKRGAPFPLQTGNERFVQQWGINHFTSGGPGGAYVGCPLDEGGHVFNNASNGGGDSGFGFGGTAGNTTRRWSAGYGEWATSAIADTLPGYIWVR
jgi:hypothetical protein